MDKLADFCLNTETLFKVTCRFHCKDRHPKLGADRGLTCIRSSRKP